MLGFLGEVFEPECTLLVPLCMGTQRGVCVDVLKALATQGSAGVAGVATVLLKRSHAVLLGIGKGVFIAHAV